MLDDVKIAAAGLAPVRFYGRMGGVVPFPDEIVEAIVRLDHETTRPAPGIERLLNHMPAGDGGWGLGDGARDSSIPTPNPHLLPRKGIDDDRRSR
jgi:2-oxoglutarate ferredoxin oxidoreductase subunit alpha